MSRRTPRTGPACALVLIAATLWVCPAHAVTDSTWTLRWDGKWSEPGNWSSGIPNGVDHVARVDGWRDYEITIDAGVPGDGVTLGSLYLPEGGSDGRLEILGAPEKCLTMDVSSGEALVYVGGRDSFSQIDVPVVMNDSTRFWTADDTMLKIHGMVSSGRPGTGLTKAGPGEMVLYGRNTYTGPTLVSEGALTSVYPDSLGIGPGPVTVADGATLSIGPQMESGAFRKDLILRGAGTDGKGALEGRGTCAGSIALADDTTIEASSSDPFVLAGPLFGPGTLVKRGTGELVLAAAGDRTGSTHVAEGVLTVRHAGALGAGPAPVTVADKATLRLEGGLTVTGKPLILNGKGHYDPVRYALDSTGGDNQWDGPVTLASDAWIGPIDNGLLTISGPIDGAAALHVVTNTDTYGPRGTLVLTGANVYTGPTVIHATLEARDGVGLPEASNLTLGGGVFQEHGPMTFTRSLGAGPGQVQWETSGGFAARGGKMTVNLGGQPTPQSLVWDQTPCFVPDGRSLFFNSPSSDSEVEFLHPIDLGGKDRVISVRDNPDSGDDVTVISGTVSNGELWKYGVGTLVLTGQNTYRGPTLLGEGALRATDGVGLPRASNLVLKWGVFEGNGPTAFTRSLGPGGGQVQWHEETTTGGFAAHGGKMTVNLGGQGGQLVWGSTPYFLGPIGWMPHLLFGSATADAEVEFQNPIRLSNYPYFRVLDNPNSGTDFATLSGVLSSGSLRKGGDGTLVLTARNTYSGLTGAYGGALRAEEGIGLPSGSPLRIDGTGVYEGTGPTTFTRSLGAGPGQIEFLGGGFAAYGGKMTVNIGGRGGSPQPLVWNVTPYFGEDEPWITDPDLTFGSATCDSEVEFRNPIDLGGKERTILVRDNPFADGDFTTLSGRLSNGGLQKTGHGLLVLAAVTNTCTGAMIIEEGTLKVTGKLLSDLIDVRAAATFDVQNLGVYRMQYGTMLTGDGQVVGRVQMYGTVAPGSGIGTLSVCDIIFDRGSTLAVELGSTEWGIGCDRLVASGAATSRPDSTLDVTLLDGFTPIAGDVFDILDFGSISGSFTTLNLPDLEPGLWWDTDALYTDGTLAVVPEPATLMLLAVGGLALLRRKM